MTCFIAQTLLCVLQAALWGLIAWSIPAGKTAGLLDSGQPVKSGVTEHQPIPPPWSRRNTR